MIAIFFEEEFKNIDFTTGKLLGEEYENCIFVNCNFSKTNCSEVKFIESEFDNCCF